ncbi:hypothetical protein C8K38_12345 [Rhodococcus sp. OK611]|jgi:hypothetical protein|uniref:DUF7715 family protein n=1 Tax=Rhodococcus TaxID=1827 RepID=UPI000BC56620|nr:hypothetical protein C8K38_12345 [Rhodococcus sp. OK611]SNX93746.1 hypothetical protein SAMN05447004_12345 [Rhodococcus sp. OK270]
MRGLVATARTQGQRDNDFDFCVEGELVWIGLVCARDEADPDGGCGCGRAFSGLNSHRATTTARVAELAGFTGDDYVEALRSGLAQAGWPPNLAGELAGDMLAIAAHWPAGTVIERRLDRFQARGAT